MISIIYSIMSTNQEKKEFFEAEQTQKQPQQLKKLFQENPAKEIINDNYSPDVTPIIKLVAFDNEGSNLKIIAPSIKNKYLQEFGKQFLIVDCLGYQYAKKMSQLVFLKFDNEKYNFNPKNKPRGLKLLSGLFVPFSHFEDSFQKNQQNKAKQISNQIADFKKKEQKKDESNNKGYAFDPLFISNYESSNLFAVFRRKPFKYDLILQNDINSEIGLANTFNFTAEFKQEGYYTFKIANLTFDPSLMIEAGMKICYNHLSLNKFRQTTRTCEHWKLGCEKIVSRRTEIQIENLKNEYYYQLQFQYRCKNKHDRITFSLNYPNTTLDCQKFFNKVILKKMKSTMNIQKIQITRTVSGNPIHAYCLNKKKSNMASLKVIQQRRPSMNSLQSFEEPKEKSIFIIGRQHPCDTEGSFVIEGMVQYLVDGLQFQSLKKHYRFYFVPIMNFDGVKYGNSNTNITGSDLKKNWKNPSQFYHPQVFYLKKFMTEVNKQNPISLILNLSSQKQSTFTTFNSTMNDQQDPRIIPLIFSKRNKGVSFQQSIFFPKNKNNSFCSIMSEFFPKTLCYDIKISQFEKLKLQKVFVEDSDSEIENNLRQITPQSLRNFGKQFISLYLQHLKINSRNNLLKDKWMREILQKKDKTYKTSLQYIQQKKIDQKFDKQFIKVNFQPKPVPNKSLTTQKISTQKTLKSKKNIYLSSKDLTRASKRPTNVDAHGQNQSKATEPQSFSHLNSQNELAFENDVQKVQIGNQVYKIRKSSQKKRTSILKNFSSNVLNLNISNQPITQIMVDQNCGNGNLKKVRPLDLKKGSKCL